MQPIQMEKLIFMLTISLVMSSSSAVNRNITIGAVVSAESHGIKFHEIINKLNNDEDALPDGITLIGKYIIMDENPIQAAKAICDHLIPNQVYVTIASHAKHRYLSPVAVSFTCGYYRIPVIGVAARESAFSDKNVHSSFMRTVPPYSEQADPLVDMLQLFQFKRVIFVHSSDQEGRAMLGKFQSRAESRDIQIDNTIQYKSGLGNYTEILSGIHNLSSRVILLFARSDDAEIIYQDATRLNLTNPGYAWVVTEQALHTKNVPVGVLGLELSKSNDEDGHIDDSLHVIAQALKQMHDDGENITEAPTTCDDGSDPWESGPHILKYLQNERLEPGKTGYVMFNDQGDRMNSIYNIINIQKNGPKRVGQYGSLLPNKKLDIPDVSAIIWPGNKSQKPKGIKISTHLRVVTMEALPFVYVEPIAKSGGKCDVTENNHPKLPCPRHNNSEGGVKQEYCCYGYAVDLLIALAKNVNFTFELHLSEESTFGSKDRRNGSSEQTWNGMIGEVVYAKSDMIVAPLTINPERAEAIDFSKPFKYQGLTILVKKKIKDSSLASFLQPFQDTLWILVGLSVHVVALVLYLLDRFSPFGRFKLAKSDDTEEDALNLSSAMWFAWGVLLNSGIGEGTPRSFSARVLGMVWAGFAMIIVASYTANLAAFLVLDRPEADISGIDDARLRNPQERFTYATVKNSAVAMYFKRQVELSTMHRTMEGRYYQTAEEAIEHVRIGKLHAFIWDSSRLQYEAAKDCDLMTAGELFGRSGYGIGLPKGSPWTNEISLAILGFHETGTMEKMDQRWILVPNEGCPEKDPSPATLGLTNMAGVFMMVAGGIVAGVFLIFIEIAYKRHRGLKEKELELAKTAADRWRGNIEKRKRLRQSRAMLRKQQGLFFDHHQPNGPHDKETTHAPSNFTPTTAGEVQQGNQREGVRQSRVHGTPNGDNHARSRPVNHEIRLQPEPPPTGRYQYEI